ncbi:MAG: SAM-dependent methyltransferase, partial [Bacteroidota bacterium]
GKSVHRNFDMADFNAFFAPFNFHFVSFPNQQFFNREALLGRYLSSSYAYTSDHPKFELARKELFKIFDRFAVESEVSFNYAIQVYVGQLK